MTDAGADAGRAPPAAALLRDLYEPDATRYRVDLVLAALLGWGAFAMLCRAGSVPAGIAWAALAVVLLYRAHLFVHELSHAARRIPGFAAMWNLLAGFPLLVPSSFAVGVHALHHNAHVFGTAGDPEYLPFARSRRLIVRFVALTLLFPILMAVRFLVLGPVALLVPPLQRHLERHATSLAMNPAFVRKVTPEEHRAMIREQIGILAFWAPWLALLATGILPWRVALCWLAVATAISIVNGVRALGAHRYEGADPEFDRVGQFEDSIDTPGGWWTELWAPVGHRYHALHHFAPGLPYHNLGIAYRRLEAAETNPRLRYEVATSPGLASSLGRLWQRAGGRT